MDIEETKGKQNSKRKHKVTIFKRKSMINSIFAVSNMKGILKEKTESRRNSFSNKNGPVEECKEDPRNQIESPPGEEQEKFHDVTFMKKDTINEERNMAKPPLPPVYENRFSGTESNRSEISLQDHDIVSVLNEPNIIITNNDDESFSSLVAKRLMLNEQKETKDISAETVVKQKNNILSLLVQKQIEFVKNKSNSKSSAILPDAFSSSDKKEMLAGFNMDNSTSNYKKLKTTSSSNTSASVHFDSTIKKLKTKLYETKNKNIIPKLDYSNPQEVKETNSLGSSHVFSDFSRAEQNELTNHKTEWSSLNEKISSTLNHMSTETYKDSQSLEVRQN